MTPNMTDEETNGRRATTVLTEEMLTAADRAFQCRILCIGALITLAGAAVAAYFLYPIVTGA